MLLPSSRESTLRHCVTISRTKGKNCANERPSVRATSENAPRETVLDRRNLSVLVGCGARTSSDVYARRGDVARARASPDNGARMIALTKRPVSAHVTRILRRWAREWSS